MYWEIETVIYTLLGIKQVTNENTLHSRAIYSVLYGDLNGEELQSKRGVRIHTAD